MRLAGMTCAVEFRNGSWLNEKNAERTLGFLEDRGCLRHGRRAAGLQGSVPPVNAVTSGARACPLPRAQLATWEAKGISPAERFRYLYRPRARGMGAAHPAGSGPRRRTPMS